MLQATNDLSLLLYRIVMLIRKPGGLPSFPWDLNFGRCRDLYVVRGGLKILGHYPSPGCTELTS